jgi:hypothetical protein
VSPLASVPAAYGYWFVSAGRMVPQVGAASNPNDSDH